MSLEFYRTAIKFNQTYLKELFETGKCSDKKHRYQPQIVKNYQRRIEQLQSAQSAETLYQLNSLKFEALKGDKSGLFSIRVNNQYRIEFTLEKESDLSVLTICNIIELSNHYE